MGDWPLMGAYYDGNHGILGAECTTHGSSTNTKGSWSEITSGLTYPFYAMTVHCLWSNSYRGFLLDIGIGAGGSEVTIIENLHMTETTNNGDQNFTVHFPIYVAEGTRIAARAQTDSGTSQTIRPEIRVWRPNFNSMRTGSVVTTYGADTSDSGGTALDPGGTASTWQSYVVFSSSTALPIKGLVLVTGHHSDPSETNGSSFYVEVAYGASGYECTVLQEYCYTHSSSSTAAQSHFQYWPVDIPAGSRLVARCQSNNTTAGERVHDLIMYAIS